MVKRRKLLELKISNDSPPLLFQYALTFFNSKKCLDISFVMYFIFVFKVCFMFV